MKYSPHYNPKLFTKKLLAITCLSAALGLVACEQEGSAEKAGQKIDKAVENAGQKIDLSSKKAEQKMDQVVEKTEQRLEVAKQSMVDSSKASGEYMDDSVITANIKATMLKDDFLKLVPIDVTTVNGIVKLSGTVDSEQLVGRAIGLANSQAHVKSVQNELKVKVIVPSKQ